MLYVLGTVLFRLLLQLICLLALRHLIDVFILFRRTPPKTCPAGLASVRGRHLRLSRVLRA